MKRRRALSVVGLSALPLSGCLDSVGRDGTPGDPGSGDGRSVTASLSRVAGDGAIGFSCDVRRSEIGEGSPAVVELTARNETEREIEYVTGAPEPFGVLYDPDAPAAILWTEKYVESQHVETEGRRVTGGDDIGISVALAPGGSRSETYEFAAPPGSYSIRQTGNPITLGEETYELRIDVAEA